MSLPDKLLRLAALTAPVVLLVQDWYVDQAACAAGAGSGTPSDPFCTIGAAIAAATDGDTIHIAPGTYPENLTLDKELDLVGTGGRDVTVVDGRQLGTTLRVFEAASITGLTITGGRNLSAAGGVWTTAPLTLTSSTVTGNTVFGNYAYGAGIYVSGHEGSLTMVGSTVSDNLLTDTFNGYGAGIYGGDLHIVDSRITGNTSDSLFAFGSGIVAWGDFTLTNSTVIGNVLTQHASPRDVALFDPDATIASATLGTLLFAGSSDPKSPATLSMTNSIVLEDSFDFGTTAMTIEHSNLAGRTGPFPGAGNLAADPRFVDPAGGDFRLLPTSPCVDAGSNALVPPGVLLDVLGLPRFIDHVATPDTGAGVAPIVDMGAHERANVWDVTPLPPVRGVSR